MISSFNRHFTVEGPDRLWIGDITEHPSREGKVYVAAILDAWNRECIGWSITDHSTEIIDLAAEPSDSLASDTGSRIGSTPVNSCRAQSRFRWLGSRLMRCWYEGWSRLRPLRMRQARRLRSDRSSPGNRPEPRMPSIGP